MNKIDILKQLKDLRDTCKEYNMIEVNEKDIEALSIAIDLLKETAPEVPVQEQLSSIGKKIKLIQVSQTIYFILTMAVINLMFYRFNKIFQGFADIFYGNINIFETIIDIFKSI